MSDAIDHGHRLEEACLLTGAVWGVIVSRVSGEWQMRDTYRLSKKRRFYLVTLLEKDEIIFLLDNAVKERKPNHTPIEAQKSQGYRFLYAFPDIATVLLLGTQDNIDERDLRLWKLAINNEDTPSQLNTGEDVGLLQHTVLELQQTQQELQARISAQREAEARLIQAAKLAAVGEMAAGIAHELNNPLTSVVGFTELALDELPVDSTVRDDLELVLKEARRARSVVRRLLDFARQADSVRVKADINEIVDDVLMLTKHLMQTSNVKSEIRLGENLSWVSVDRNQIKQVVINLVNNALYAMPMGGRIVVETQEQVRYGRKWLTLLVRDSGVGIPPENLERIFEPFFTTRGDRGGTGLGLSVTYGIVTDHGGMIEVESQLRIGSTFIVWLPLDQ